jgi:hypothetical protein
MDRLQKEDGQIVEISPYTSVNSPKEFGKRSYLFLESMMLLWRFGTMRNPLRTGGQKLRCKEERREKLCHQLSCSFLGRFGRNAMLVFSGTLFPRAYCHGKNRRAGKSLECA